MQGEDLAAVNATAPGNLSAKWDQLIVMNQRRTNLFRQQASNVLWEAQEAASAAAVSSAEATAAAEAATEAAQQARDLVIMCITGLDELMG